MMLMMMVVITQYLWPISPMQYFRIPVEDFLPVKYNPALYNFCPGSLSKRLLLPAYYFQ